MTTVPIACTLTGAAQAERRDVLAREIFGRYDEVEELADGYAFRFADAEVMTAPLVEFIAFERGCCPFFSFELAFEPEHGPLWLRLRGPDGVKAFIREGMAPTLTPAANSQ